VSEDAAEDYFAEHTQRLLEEQLPAVEKLAERIGVDRNTAFLFLLGRYMEATNTSMGALVGAFNSWAKAQIEYNDLYREWTEEQRSRQEQYEAMMKRVMEIMEIQEDELRRYRDDEDWKYGDDD